jgi:F-type H+-transporting ATPase subunit c
VSKRSFLTTALVLVAGAFFSPVYAQTAEPANTTVAQWSIITAGFAAVSAATEAIARNPGAAGDIRGSLLLGLVLIESLAIYALLIALILFFVNPFVPST